MVSRSFNRIYSFVVLGDDWQDQELRCIVNSYELRQGKQPLSMVILRAERVFNIPVSVESINILCWGELLGSKGLLEVIPDRWPLFHSFFGTLPLWTKFLKKSPKTAFFLHGNNVFWPILAKKIINRKEGYPLRTEQLTRKNLQTVFEPFPL